MFPSLSRCFFCRFENQISSYFCSKIKYSLNVQHKNIYKTISLPSITQIHTSSVNNSFWEPDRKGGYDTKFKEKISTIQQIRSGIKELKTEIGIWKDEIIERLESDPYLNYKPGETDVMWQFDDKSKLNGWVTTSDRDHSEGFSKCTFEMSTAGRGMFSGVLETRVPQDGKIKKAGYCGLRSARYRKSFKRADYYDWSVYNTLVMKVRGDGRSYMINLSTEGYFDIMWNDIYHFVLYTRGGPYWQISRIPFSKFFMGAKGRIQDKQSRVPLDKISHFGISCADKINGPFALEIEYIGLEFDPLHEEETAYEMYNTTRFMNS